MYLHVTPNRPNTVKNAIPYGLGIRAKRICSTEEDYKMQRTEIKSHLRKRGYDQNLVEDQLKKVDNLDRETLLRYNTRKQANRVPLVTTYSKGLPNIHSILKKNMKILYQSERMKKISKNHLLFRIKGTETLKIY